MKHKIHESSSDTDVIEWRLTYDEDGEVTLQARRNSEWADVLWIGAEGRICLAGHSATELRMMGLPTDEGNIEVTPL